MRQRVQLITYVDRFGGRTLAELRALLDGPLQGLFGGVHLLPFFHRIDGADAGFDPIDHTEVDARLGDWDDVRALAASTPVMADVIVNHISSASPQFRDYLVHGAASRHAGMFLTFEKVFPHGATPADLAAIYRPRPGLPFTALALADGRRQQFWTTFTPQQIDLDVEHPAGAAYLATILERLAASGVTMVRLDAIGFAIKRAGRSSFMLPETFEFIDQFAAAARARGLRVLVEVHAYYRRQIEVARQVDWVYDFALPPLVLHALEFGRADALRAWLDLRPENAVTVLDTHDGIGIIDIGADPADPAARPGLVPPAELEALVAAIDRNAGGASRLASGAAASNLDQYQVNCTFYDALGRDDAAYLAARAIQLFVPGIPQIYYVGLLAGENDMALLAATGVGRDINRPYYTQAEVLAALGRPVVQRLLELIRLRNAHPAFGGSFRVLPASAHSLLLRWDAVRCFVELEVDLQARRARIRHEDGTIDLTTNGKGLL